MNNAAKNPILNEYISAVVHQAARGHSVAVEEEAVASMQRDVFNMNRMNRVETQNLL